MYTDAKWRRGHEAGRGTGGGLTSGRDEEWGSKETEEIVVGETGSKRAEGGARHSVSRWKRQRRRGRGRDRKRGND